MIFFDISIFIQGNIVSSHVIWIKKSTSFFQKWNSIRWGGMLYLDFFYKGYPGLSFPTIQLEHGVFILRKRWLSTLSWHSRLYCINLLYYVMKIFEFHISTVRPLTFLIPVSCILTEVCAICVSSKH